MAGPQFKPALDPSVQARLDAKYVENPGLASLIETLNPNIKDRPEWDRIKKGAGFLKDIATDPLNLLGPAGAGVKAAGFFSDVPPFLVKKLMKAFKKRDDAFVGIKREKDNVRIDGRAALKGELKERAKFTKANAELKKVADQIFKETGKKVPIKFTPSNTTNPRMLGLESLIKDPRNIFHGSTKKGIEQLLLNPKGTSPGGLYFTDEFLDPRLKDYVFRPSEGAGSAYVVKPDFKNTVVAGNLDKKTDKLFRQMEKQLTKDDKFNEAVFQLSQTRAPILGGPITGFTEKAGQALKEKGIDSILYPTRTTRGYSDTLVSLSPEINTKILGEMSLSELNELVRRLSRNK